MASGNDLQPNTETGWRRGFRVLLGRENDTWWKTRRWISTSITYLLILNGILLAVLNTPDAAQSGEAGLDKVGTAIAIFVTLIGLAPVISVVIIGQDTIIGEKQSGTAAWMLSKPVSRSAFILSKLIAHSLGFLVTICVIQGLAAYFILSSAAGKPLAVPGFIAGMLLVFLNLLFYITLSLMLGVLFDQRGGVIGIGLALAFGYQIISSIAPWLMLVMPWGLIGTSGSQPPFAAAVMLGQTPPTYLPVIATLLWCILFVGVALWRFERAEF